MHKIQAVGSEILIPRPVKVLTVRDSSGAEVQIPRYVDGAFEASRIAQHFGIRDTSPSDGGSVNTSIFLSRQLEELDPRWHEYKLPPLESDVIPLFPGVKPGRDVVRWQVKSQDFRGTFNSAQTALFDTAATGFTGHTDTMNVDYYQGYSQLTQGQILAAAANEMPLDTMSILAIKKEGALVIDQLAMIGDGSSVYGVLNASGTETLTLPYHTGGSDGRWCTLAGVAVKTAAEIMADLREATQSLAVKTNKRFKTTHLFLSNRLENYIRGLPVNESFPLYTVYQWFKQNYPNVELVGSRYMGLVSSTFPDPQIASKLVAVDLSDPSYMGKVVALPPTLLPVQFFGMTVRVPVMLQAGGTAVVQKNSICVCSVAAGTLEETV